MIAVRLKGGLGNQMFQFAFGLSLSHSTNSNLILDHSFLNHYPKNGTYTFRNYALDIFKLQDVKESVSIYLKYFPRNKVLHDGFSKLYRIFNNLTYIKEDFLKNPTFYKELSKNKYLNGYWQNPSYFINIENQLKELFSFDEDQLTNDNLKVLDEIQISNSCSIHIRGGDYKNSANHARFGQLDHSFYHKAIEHINKKKLDLKFFVFSNDHRMAHHYLSDLGIDLVHVQCNQTANHYYDMMLMSKCKHNISGNSSFSWWANFLNQNENAIKIIPEHWYTDQATRSQQIAIPSWTRL